MAGMMGKNGSDRANCDKYGEECVVFGEIRWIAEIG